MDPHRCKFSKSKLLDHLPTQKKLETVCRKLYDCPKSLDYGQHHPQVNCGLIEQVTSVDLLD